MHYRFWFSFNLYKKREPEILFDAPRRLEPGENLPVSLIIKDSHKYPIQLKNIRLSIIDEPAILKEISVDQPLSQLMYYQIIEFSAEALERFRGRQILIQASVEIELRGKRKTIKIHNLSQLPHQPLEVFIAIQQLPGSGNYEFGDIHAHSDYTDDQVEFGPPVDVLARSAKAFGMHWQPVTDHSYDLDDEPGYHYKPSPELTRWQMLKKDIVKYSNDKMKILLGEEVSAGNHLDENVHFLVIGHPEFIPGKGDGGEVWFRYRPDFSTNRILKMVSQDTLLIAAHPLEKVPFIQKPLLNRGNWIFEQPDRLDGFQILNGKANGDLRRGIKEWVKQLLKGRRFFIYGGSDAHGNFNRYRQIRIPMLLLTENGEHTLGSSYTAVLRSVAGESLQSRLKRGACIATMGYSIDMNIENEQGDSAGLGEELEGHHFIVNVLFESTEEFGGIDHVKLCIGDIESGEEILMAEHRVDGLKAELRLKIPNISRGYVRAEAWGTREGQSMTALSNPLWFRQDSSL